MSSSEDSDDYKYESNSDSSDDESMPRHDYHWDRLVEIMDLAQPKGDRVMFYRDINDTRPLACTSTAREVLSIKEFVRKVEKICPENFKEKIILVCIEKFQEMVERFMSAGGFYDSLECLLESIRQECQSLTKKGIEKRLKRKRKEADHLDKEIKKMNRKIQKIDKKEADSNKRLDEMRRARLKKFGHCTHHVDFHKIKF